MPGDPARAMTRAQGTALAKRRHRERSMIKPRRVNVLDHAALQAIQVRRTVRYLFVEVAASNDRPREGPRAPADRIISEVSGRRLHSGCLVVAFWSLRQGRQAQGQATAGNCGERYEKTGHDLRCADVGGSGPRTCRSPGYR